MCVSAGPPEIQLPQGGDVEVAVADNSTVEIKCPFRSLPAPSVTWFKVQSDGKSEEINSLAGGFTYDTGPWLALTLTPSLPPSLPPSLSLGYSQRTGHC